jgi:hypothetical protein
MIIPDEVKKKPFEYIILALSFILGIFFYVILNDYQARKWIICTVGATYFGWSLHHHYRRGDLQLSIMVEYLLIILIGIILLFNTLP